MPTPDRRPRGHNRRAQQRRQDESQGTLLQRINAATLPLRQRLGQGMSGLGQRNKEPKAASFKLASPLPRKHTIGLLVLIPLWLLVLAWEPAPPPRPRRRQAPWRSPGRAGPGPDRRQRR